MMSCRQPLVFLQEAQEIKVNYNDIKRLADFVTDEWTCEADVVIYLPKDQLIDWENINTYKDNLKIVIAVEDTGIIPIVKDFGYKVFWSYPASSYWELKSLLELGVDQILLDGPLYFDIPRVKNICGEGVELRLVVNKCYNNHLPRKNGICGTYIRPEDVEIYSNFIDHFEFDADNNLSKEHTLYEIYTKDKQWPGNLNILLTNLNADVDNRGFELSSLTDDFDEKFFARTRLNCQQRCQRDNNSSCNLCNNTFDLINTLQEYALKEKYFKSKDLS